MCLSNYNDNTLHHLGKVVGIQSFSLKYLWISLQIHKIFNLSYTFSINPIQDGPFWDCSQMGGRGVKRPLYLKSVILIAHRRYVRQKYIIHVTHPLSSSDINIFHQKLAILRYKNKNDILAHRLQFF